MRSWEHLKVGWPASAASGLSEGGLALCGSRPRCMQLSVAALALVFAAFGPTGRCWLCYQVQPLRGGTCGPNAFSGGPSLLRCCLGQPKGASGLSASRGEQSAPWPSAQLDRAGSRLALAPMTAPSRGM